MKMQGTCADATDLLNESKQCLRLAADGTAAEKYFEEKGIRIELLDGEQFAKLIVEHGIRTS